MWGSHPHRQYAGRCASGRIVIIGNTSGPQAEIDIRYIFGKQISLIGSTMGSHQDFRDVTSLLWAGKLKAVIDRVMPLSEGIEAYRIMERGEQFGKIVLVHEECRFCRARVSTGSLFYVD